MRPLIGGQAVTSYSVDRVCAAPDCTTILSRYNPTRYCTLHARTQKRRRLSNAPERSCICAYEACGEEFLTRNRRQVYCSDRCRMAAFWRRRHG